VSDGFDWGLTPRKPEPEKPLEPEKPAEPETPDPFAFLNQRPDANQRSGDDQQPAASQKPVEEEWVGEPTQAMPLNAPPALIEPKMPPEPPRAPLPTAPAYPPQQQFRPPSQYPQATPPAAAPTPEPTPPAWPFAAQQLPPTQAQHLPPAQVSTRVPSAIPDAAASATTDRHGIDDIFGEHAFQEYDDGPLIGQIPLPSRAERRDRPTAEISRAQKVLMGVAGGLVVVLAIVAIYLVGTRIDLSGDEPAAVVTPDPTATEEATTTEGPLEPGTYQWDDLLGTECLEPFENAWEQQYTVVDCESPHGGQLTAVGAFEQTEFPGAEALATDANLACASTKVINYKKASVYDDIAISASYATTQQEWTDGFTDYYCFVARTSGEPIEGTIARAFGTAAG